MKLITQTGFTQVYYTSIKKEYLLQTFSFFIEVMKICLQEENIFDKLSFNLFQAITYSFLFAQPLKPLIGRGRPNGSNNRSMPSGHTSQSFAVAAVVNEIYGHNAGILAYLVASLVGVSRINDNEHYLSDVIIGAGLGTAIGRGFAKTYKENIYMPNMSINLTFNF